MALSILFLGCTVNGCRTASTTEPDPPGGGQKFVLDYDMFASQIDSTLTANGCDIVACHGGGIRGTFELSPNTNKDIDLDFAQASLQTNGNDPAASALLMKPLAEGYGGSLHAGGSAFADTADPDYQAILAWIEAGIFQ